MYYVYIQEYDNEDHEERDEFQLEKYILPRL